MDVDPNPAGQDTPQGTPFDDGFTPPTSRGQHAADPFAHIHTGNYFTPLSTEPQETDSAAAEEAWALTAATAAAHAAMDEAEARRP